MDIEVNKLNEVFLGIAADLDIQKELKRYTSCFAPAYKFHPLFKQRRWDGKISFYNIKNQTLPIGILPLFIEFCKDYKYSYHLNFDTKELSNKISIEEIDNFLDNILENSKYKLRDYQRDEIYKCIRNKRGLVESATGSGKSLVIYCIIRYLYHIDKKLLLIVPNVSLVEQMFGDFKDYGWDCEDIDILYSGKEITDKKILVSTWQSVYKKSADFFSNFESLLIDECVAGDTTVEILSSNGFIEKPIKDVLIGDLVKCYDIKKGTKWKKVLKKYKNLSSTEDNMYEIKIGKDILKITGNHQIYVVKNNKLYKKRVDQLTITDEVWSLQ